MTLKDVWDDFFAFRPIKRTCPVMGKVYMVLVAVKDGPVILVRNVGSSTYNHIGFDDLNATDWEWV